MSVPLRTILEDKYGLKLTIQAGREGLDNPITSDLVQKAGLAMTGFVQYAYPGWIQVLGNSEISYLLSQTEERRRLALTALCQVKVAAIVVTRDLPVPDLLVELCDHNQIPLLYTPLLTEEFFDLAHRILQGLLAPTTSLHGVLMDVLGVGILLLGESGIGKSECALELVYRGHRLVADDIVDVRRIGDTLVGRGYDLIKHHMEIRGLGIINIKDLFGIAAVRDTKKIQLCLELVEWDEDVEYDRLGIDQSTRTILGVEIPYMVIPVGPGRNIAIIVEIAARNQLLKVQGHYSAVDFQQKLMDQIAANIHEEQTVEDVE
ncbi:MAG: HPr(Ser) kinase/phosphatase [Bradymonadales bacterium]|nr:HPr(Ser) kinase/phosphatase [Bradymonadales bacterium]